MHVKEHLKLSTAAATLALPLLKQDIWIPFAASILIDVDHYIWHALTYRNLSLKDAVRFFGQADPPQARGAKFLHQPLVLGFLLYLAIRFQSRILSLILAGMIFHVCIDAVHITQMARLKHSLSELATHSCPECGCADYPLQLHTVHYSRNLLTRYQTQHFVVLCPDCHVKAHA